MLHSKRAFTLAELVVVMAVMGIMVMMVVSFTTLCHAWSTWGTNQYNLVKSERQTEQLLRQFVSAYDSTDYYFEVAEGRTQLVAVCAADTDKRYAFSYNGSEVEYQRPVGENGYMPVDFIRSLQFTVYTNERKQQLVQLRLTYELPDLGLGKIGNMGTYDIVVCARSEGVAA